MLLPKSLRYYNSTYASALSAHFYTVIVLLNLSKKSSDRLQDAYLMKTSEIDPTCSRLRIMDSASDFLKRQPLHAPKLYNLLCNGILDFVNQGMDPK